MHCDLIIRNGTVLLPWGPHTLDLAARGGRIVALGAPSDWTATDTVDATGLHVLPGVIDSHVHFREPGHVHKEDLATGSASAVLGGVTTVFEMPNTRPATTSAEALADKLRRARGRCWTDHAFFVGATRDNIDQLASLEDTPGCAGVKLYMGSSTGDLLIDDDEGLLDVLRAGRRRVAVHAEDEGRLQDRRPLAVDHARHHGDWRDPETARLATARLLVAARRAGRPVHLVHASTARELDLVAAHRDLCTVEITPQHLTLRAPDAPERLGSRAQMNPPIREDADRLALWRAVASGLADTIASDHAPHTLQEKALLYPNSPSGMPGVQTLLPVMLEQVHQGRISLARLVDLVSAGPARVYGLPTKGRIIRGADADLTLVDLQATHEITDEWIASRCGWSPFAGVRVHGWPVHTIVGGQLAVRDGELCGGPAGRPVRVG